MRPWSTPTHAHGPYAYGATPPNQGTNGLAVASLVCSLLGVCLCVLPIAGVEAPEILMQYPQN